MVRLVIAATPSAPLALLLPGSVVATEQPVIGLIVIVITLPPPLLLLLLLLGVLNGLYRLQQGGHVIRSRAAD